MPSHDLEDLVLARGKLAETGADTHLAAVSLQQPAILG